MSASTLQAEFDGRVFVPRQQVSLPVGTTVEVLIPPTEPSAEDDREWRDLLQEIHGSEPTFPTVDEALPQSRIEEYRPRLQRPGRFAEELRSLFAATGEESFEDGCDSDFSAEVGRVILTHGHEAVEFVSKIIGENSLPSEVAAQTLRCLGELRHSETYEARRELLERSLKNSSHVIRDGALIGLSWLNDPQTIPALETALDCEDHEFLRANLSKLRTRLKG